MSEPGAAAPPRRRRWMRLLIALGLAAALLSAVTTWLLQPEQLVPLVLDRVGKALALEITASGDAEVRLRGKPQLVIRGLVAREAGVKTPLLRADRVLLALPWSTLRSGGDDLTIERVELDTPVLDIPAMQAWLAKRPTAAETKIPVLTNGLRVTGGLIENHDWRIEGIDVRLPSLHPDQPVDARIQGRYSDQTTKIPFDLAVALTKPANTAGVAIVGSLTIERGSWRLPSTVNLSGPLHLGNDTLTVTPAKLGLSARFESGDTRLPFSLGLYGPLRFEQATWVLAPAGMALRGDEPIPDFDAHGALALGRRLVIELDGALPEWPASWPVLPTPVSKSKSPMPFALRYTGKPDLTDIAGLRLNRDKTLFEGRFQLYAVLDWIDQTGGSPLPPLSGRLTTPQLDISGATLEGVDIVLDDGDVASP